MAGVLHPVFGLITGLAIWAISGEIRGQKRWTLSLVFVYAFNNYIGPDLGNIIGELGEAVNSEVLFELGISLHSYFGWIVWASIYSFLWFPLVAVLDKHSEQNGIKQGVLEKGMPVTHGRGDVYIAVLVGGMGHHFVDALSHYADPVSGKYYPRGRFALITPQDPSLILVYVIFAAFIAALFIVNGIRKKSINKTMFARLPSLLRSKQFLLAVVFTGIALVNCGAMYLVMASKNVVVTDTADFNGQEYVRIFFYLGNALFATHIYDSGEFVVYSAICILVFVIVFMFAYVKRVKISIRRIAVRLDVLAIIGFVLSIVIGYLLQPVFGNISGEERDFGAFIFLWSTIGTLLAGAASIKAMPSNVGAIRVDETNK